MNMNQLYPFPQRFHDLPTKEAPELQAREEAEEARDAAEASLGAAAQATMAMEWGFCSWEIFNQ